MRFRGIAFDMDGVLVDSERCHATAFDSLWASLGIDGPEYTEIAGRPTVDVVIEHTKRLGPTASDVADWVERKQRAARTCLSTAEILFPDVEATLKSLHETHALALVTGGSRATVESTLMRYGLVERFGILVTGDDVTPGKPAPAPYLKAAAAIVDSPDQMLVVEDSGNGIVAGLAAGAFVVSVRSFETRDHNCFLGAFESLDHMVSSLEMLP